MVASHRAKYCELDAYLWPFIGGGRTRKQEFFERRSMIRIIDIVMMDCKGKCQVKFSKCNG